jgi:predicted alpha-1,2-mannosidase
MMKRNFIILTLSLFLFGSCFNKQNLAISYVNKFTGSSGNGRVIPAVALPFGMVQVGPDTRTVGSGYDYKDPYILGFSHLHKNGGGCNDLLDILFQPTTGRLLLNPGDGTPGHGYSSFFSHNNEKTSVNSYSVLLDNYNIKVELTATQRCAFHKYTFPVTDSANVIIDLKHGSTSACSILPQEDFDTVFCSQLSIPDNQSIEGYRISNGWAKEQHVYFAAKFSKPFEASGISSNGILISGKVAVSSAIKGFLRFKTVKNDSIVFVKVGISNVNIEGARKNLEIEIPDWNYEKIKKKASETWCHELDKIEIETDDPKLREIFYSGLYNVLLYPTLYSDADGSYRLPVNQLEKTDLFNYYGGHIGLWDVFRAASPLITILEPSVSNDLIQTFLTFYNHTGLLPVFPVANNETFCMIGYHSMPVIADTYFKGIRNYDVDAVYEAMRASASKDTFGISMGRYLGSRNYKKFHYIPADLEFESVAQTLEFSYDDWCIAQMAKMLGKKADYDYYISRAEYYKNVIEPQSGFARGKLSDGSWHNPFNPLASNHRCDDYCEGNAWQWTFFVPHDPHGLAGCMGGDKRFIEKLDSLFVVDQKLVGENASGDISGLIGQYAQGNEPSQHIIYMYNYFGQPWKAEELIRKVQYTLYNNTPDGICGNEDTGQMSAWFIWNALGFYPVTHGQGIYVTGTPLFKKMVFRHGKENAHKLTILAPEVSKENGFIQSVKLDGKPYDKSWFNHFDLFGDKDVCIEFQMGSKPNKEWGVNPRDMPVSLSY